jgi:hypothetical protein
MQHNQWYAIATDFSIAGVGTTRQDACDDLSALVECHLRSYHDESRQLESAWQPLSLIRKLRMLIPLKHKTRLVLYPAGS